ncbi:hypothetical protein ACWCL1_08220 [Ligilactobacillus sp. LYQ135]
MNKLEWKMFLYMIVPATICYEFGMEYFYLYMAIFFAGVQFIFSNDFLEKYNIKDNENIMKLSRMEITKLSISVLISKLILTPVINLMDYLAIKNTINIWQLIASRAFQVLFIFLCALLIQGFVLGTIEPWMAQKIKQKIQN